jgi:hypothetical protein
MTVLQSLQHTLNYKLFNIQTNTLFVIQTSLYLPPFLLSPLFLSHPFYFSSLSTMLSYTLKQFHYSKYVITKEQQTTCCYFKHFSCRVCTPRSTCIHPREHACVRTCTPQINICGSGNKAYSPPVKTVATK